MSNSLQPLSTFESLLQKKNIVRAATIFSIVSLSFYLFFSGPMLGVERPFWYQVITFVLQDLAIIGAGIVCFRNGFSKQMPSGSRVWLLIGLALFSFLIGDLFFGLWELLWHLDPVGSLGDIFYVILYILLLLGMVIAIVRKKVKLKIYQWSIVAVVTIYVAVIAMWITTPPTIANSTAPLAIVATVQASTSPDSPMTKPDQASTSDVPEWVRSIDVVLKPYGQPLSMFYVWCDVALFGLAVIMLLAFWGGRLSDAWQVNAQAMICLYIADMWLAYATNHISGYQSGFMLEVFWIFGIVQFGVAAALDFEHMVARRKFVDSDRYFDLGDRE
jgi:hypothetical protein